MNTLTHLTRRAALALGLAAAAAVASPAWAQAEGPDALVERVAGEILAEIKANPKLREGDLGEVMKLVDSKLMPHVNFQRMTAMAVGRHWREASPQQRERLMEEFKQLLVRTYSGALSQVGDQTLHMLPLRAPADAREIVVRAQVRGSGEPVQIEYRMENRNDAWRIYDVNVLGVWLVENYRVSFSQEINQHGIDGLIDRLSERNKALASRS